MKFVSDLIGTGRWFSLDTPVSSINKTDRHDITEILLKVTLTTIYQTKPNLIIIFELRLTFVHAVNINVLKFMISYRFNMKYIDLRQSDVWYHDVNRKLRETFTANT